MASGVPIGAVLATAEAAKGFAPGKHASTFGGNPLACAAALATLDVIVNDGILCNVREVGAYMQQRLEELQAASGLIAEVRGCGLMLGIELKEAKGAAVVGACRDRGLLINCVGDKTLRFVPPLIIQKSDVDEAVQILASVLLEAL